MSRFGRPSEEAAAQWASLQRQWSLAREGWNDEVALRFEREFWSEWQSVMPQTVELLRDLEAAMENADRVTSDV